MVCSATGIELPACSEHADVLHTAGNRGRCGRLHAGNSIPVAEHTILLMLATYASSRRSTVARAPAIEQGGCTRYAPLAPAQEGRPVGFGAIGKEVARRLRAFEVKLLYYESDARRDGGRARLGVTYLDLDALVREADIVSLHLPLDAADREYHERATHCRDEARGGVDQLCARRTGRRSRVGEALKAERLFGPASTRSHGSRLLEVHCSNWITPW